MIKCVIDYAKSLSDNIRIDTHAQNATMQNYIYYFANKDAKAKKVKDLKVKNIKTKRVKATWTQTEGIDGYQIIYKAPKVKTKKTTAKATATKKTIKKLKKGKKYTFKIRSFNYVYNPVTDKNEKVYGAWSTKKVTIKK